MAGVGTKLIQKADARAQAGARIWNSVMAQSSADARLLADYMTDKGILEDDYGPQTCSRPDCGCVIGANDEACPCCGAVVGDRLEVSTESTDEEIPRGEDIPVHAEEDELYMEVNSPLDLPECLQEGLLELGWNTDDAEEAGLILASIWPDSGPLNEAEYKTEIEVSENPLYKRLIEPETLHKMLKQFQHCQSDKPEIALSVQAELRIFYEDEYWQVEVDDPLSNKFATGRKGKIKVGDFSLSEELTQKILNNRVKRLPKLGEALINFRKEFFEADTVDSAEAVLAEKGCTQKEVAKLAGIPTSTLCRWCDEKTGIWVDTPHGVYHIRDFFGRKVKAFSGEDLRKATVLGLILDAKQALREEGQDNVTRENVINWLQANGHELNMEPRTKRWYFEQAEIMEQVMKVKSELSEDKPSLSEIAENLKNIKIDLDEEKLPYYLDMVQIYEDHSKR